jgi:hypothetical protein
VAPSTLRESRAADRENIFARRIRAAHLNARLMPREGTVKFTPPR